MTDRAALPILTILVGFGFTATTAAVDVTSRESVRDLVQTATGLGSVTGLIHAAGVSPSQASPETILRVDLYGTAVVECQLHDRLLGGG